MILSPKVVLKYGFIKNVSERDAKNPEGAGIDLRVGEVFRLEGEGFLGIEERRTPNSVPVASLKHNSSYTLQPNEYVLVRTIEEVNLPPNKVYIEEVGEVCVMADVRTRSTLFRSGVLLVATKTDPGYYGKLVFGMKNLSNLPFTFELGARIANIIFVAVKGDCNTYRGQWKGGRVSVPEGEQQV